MIVRLSLVIPPHTTQLIFTLLETLDLIRGDLRVRSPSTFPETRNQDGPINTGSRTWRSYDCARADSQNDNEKKVENWTINLIGKGTKVPMPRKLLVKPKGGSIYRNSLEVRVDLVRPHLLYEHHPFTDNDFYVNHSSIYIYIKVFCGTLKPRKKNKW